MYHPRDFTALAIYHLNLLLAFLTPKIDPAMAELDAEDGKFSTIELYIL